jgi:Rrf2 family transcriptional regulator, cysteine metabolism repressor
MIVSTRCQYALKAVFEIARRDQKQAVTIAEIAISQQIPQRYLEGILNELRKTGILDAQRGRSGGYRLAHKPEELSVGDIIRLIDGPIRATESLAEPGNKVFQPTWQKLQQVIDASLDETTFSNLVRTNPISADAETCNYAI